MVTYDNYKKHCNYCDSTVEAWSATISDFPNIRDIVEAWRQASDTGNKYCCYPCFLDYLVREGWEW